LIVRFTRCFTGASVTFRAFEFVSRIADATSLHTQNSTCVHQMLSTSALFPSAGSIGDGCISACDMYTLYFVAISCFISSGSFRVRSLNSARICSSFVTWSLTMIRFFSISFQIASSRSFRSSGVGGTPASRSSRRRSYAALMSRRKLIAVTGAGLGRLPGTFNPCPLRFRFQAKL